MEDSDCQRTSRELISIQKEGIVFKWIFMQTGHEVSTALKARLVE
jgi:hypothetical protein